MVEFIALTGSLKAVFHVVQVKAELSKIDPYFDKLADGMKAWIAAWDMVNAGSQSPPSPPR